MDKKRLELHEILCGIINITEPDGDRHTYFDPPMELRMKYPAIRYSRKKLNKVYANNMVYRMLTPYEVTVIDYDPDNDYIKQLLELPYCEHDRHYTSNNLHHDVFTLYH